MSFLVRVVAVPWPAPDADVRAKRRSIADNLELAGTLLERIPPGSADLVCLPEAFLTEGVRYTRAGAVAQHASSVRSSALSWAARLQATVCVPLLRAEGGRCFNSVEVVGPDGTLLGVYDKLHPWPSVADLTVYEKGVFPGAEAVPIATDACVIGVQICFDVHWPDGWVALAAAGVRLVVFPSEYPGGFPLQMRARDAGVTVVATVLHGPSLVVDLTGSVVYEQDASMFPHVVTLNLNRALVHLDHQESALASLMRTHAGVASRRLVHDNIVVVEAPPDGSRVEDLLTAAGIRPLGAYLAAAKREVDSLRR